MNGEMNEEMDSPIPKKKKEKKIGETNN